MDLANVVILLVVIVLVVQFWRQRSIAEYMVQYANQYCKKHKLQYISLARTGTKFTVYKGRLDWQLSYQMEFSSDGQTEYVGTIISHGKHVVSVDLPAYRVVNEHDDYI
ncbi:MAG: hypothetical protein ACJAVV_003589 [Alphaproteobacteria bacterium]